MSKVQLLAEDKETIGKSAKFPLEKRHLVFFQVGKAEIYLER